MIEDKKLDTKKMSEKEDVKKKEGDVDVFFPTPKFIETIKGERLQIPQLNLEKEIEIGQAVTRIIKSVPELKEIDFANFNANQVMNILPKLVSDIPKEFIFIATVLLNEDDKKEKDSIWIKKNLNSEILLDLVVPFFLRAAQQLTVQLAKFEKKLASLK